MLPYYTLKIVTPQGVQYHGEVVHTLLPGEIGFAGVLAYHAPFAASSAGGRLEIQEKTGETKKFKIGPGFFEVRDNEATLLTQSFASSSDPTKYP